MLAGQDDGAREANLVRYPLPLAFDSMSTSTRSSTQNFQKGFPLFSLPLAGSGDFAA